eukprot:3932152-Rhodomonas_salina.2
MLMNSASAIDLIAPYAVSVPHIAERRRMAIAHDYALYLPTVRYLTPIRSLSTGHRYRTLRSTNSTSVPGIAQHVSTGHQIAPYGTSVAGIV